MAKEKMDYISVSLEATVTSIPEEKKNHIWYFDIENRRGKFVTKRRVRYQSENPIDIHKGDKVSIFNAGEYEAHDINYIVITPDSRINAIRPNHNKGIHEISDEGSYI